MADFNIVVSFLEEVGFVNTIDGSFIKKYKRSKSGDVFEVEIRKNDKKMYYCASSTLRMNNYQCMEFSWMWNFESLKERDIRLRLDLIILLYCFVLSSEDSIFIEEISCGKNYFTLYECVDDQFDLRFYDDEVILYFYGKYTIDDCDV